MGNVENLIEYVKDLSTDEEEILIPEQMISDSELINVAKSIEMECLNSKAYKKVNYAQQRFLCMMDLHRDICAW